LTETEKERAVVLFSSVVLSGDMNKQAADLLLSGYKPQWQDCVSLYSD
jgi:hypothetical protein